METIQTAVQWLVNEYAKSFKIQVNAVMLESIEQALQMEREQILRDYEFGLHNGVCHCHGDRLINSLEYYKETYGGKDE